METALPLLMFAALFAVMMSGFPVAFALVGTGLLFAGLGWCADLFQFRDFGFVPKRIYSILHNPILMAVPLFVYMGIVLEKADLARELLDALARLLRRIRGGAVIAVVLVGMVMAASTGIVGATVVTMGVLALPSLLRQGVDRRLACGTIVASGTLGQVIPPSIVLVLLGAQMNVDVGSLFVGSIIPGLLLVGLYLVYVFVRVRMRPELAPQGEPPSGDDEHLWPLVLRAVLPPAALVVIVLGSILGGIASPTEAAGCGAAGALLITAVRRRLSRAVLRSSMRETARMTTMVFMILAGAQFFSTVFRGLRGDHLIVDFVTGLDMSAGLLVFCIMVLMFVLGFFLDFLEICFIIIPIFVPILDRIGYASPDNLLFLAVLIGVNLQTSFLTPPFGFSLFYLKGVAPPDIRTTDIYRGAVPFVCLQIVALVILCLFPALILWLPRVVNG